MAIPPPPPHAPIPPQPAMGPSPGAGGPNPHLAFIAGNGGPRATPAQFERPQQQQHNASPVHNSPAPMFMPQSISVVGKVVPFYEGYTFSVLNSGYDPKAKKWDRVHKERMVKEQSELGYMVRREKEQGKNVTDVYQSKNLAGSKRSHIGRLLQERNMAELDPQYEWKPAMIKLDLKKLSSGGWGAKFETKAMHVIIKRIPKAADLRPQTTRHSSFAQPRPGTVVDLNEPVVNRLVNHQQPLPGMPPRVQSFADAGPMQPPKAQDLADAGPMQPPMGVGSGQPCFGPRFEQQRPPQWQPEIMRDSPGPAPRASAGPQSPGNQMPSNNRGPPPQGMPGHCGRPTSVHSLDSFEDGAGPPFGESDRSGGNNDKHGGQGTKPGKPGKEKKPPKIHIPQAYASDSEGTDPSWMDDNETVLMTPSSSPSRSDDRHRDSGGYYAKPHRSDRYRKEAGSSGRHNSEYREHTRRGSALSPRGSFSSGTDGGYVVVDKARKIARHRSSAGTKYDSLPTRHHRRQNRDSSDLSDYSPHRNTTRYPRESRGRGTTDIDYELERERRELSWERERVRREKEDLERERGLAKERDHAAHLARVEAQIQALHLKGQMAAQNDRPLIGGGRGFEDDVGRRDRYDDRGYNRWYDGGPAYHNHHRRGGLREERRYHGEEPAGRFGRRRDSDHYHAGW